MISAIAFFAILGLPFFIYLANSGWAARERRGIAAGIPKPRQPKAAKAPKPGRTREARVHARRLASCGRDFTHFALALVGARDSCRHCTYLQEVPPPSDEPDDDREAAVRAAEEIIDRAKQ